MRIVAALFGAAILLHFAFGVAVRSVLGPGMEQAVGNVKGLEAASRQPPPLVKAPPRPAGRPDGDEVRPGGWGAPARD